MEMISVNILMGNEAIEYIQALETRAKEADIEVDGYTSDADWEWSRDYCKGLDRTVVMVESRTAEAVLMKLEDGKFNVSHVQIDLYSGKAHTTNHCSRLDFSAAMSRFEHEFYDMVKFSRTYGK